MAEKKVKSLGHLIGAINKKAGHTVLARLGEMENTVEDRLKTGIEGLDAALGGGFPMGRMIELYGNPSSGKTLIAQLAIAAAQKKERGDCIFFDAEGSFDPNFAKKLGVDVPNLVLAQVGIGEDIFDLIANILRAEPAVIVIDSIGGMTTNTEYDAEFGKQHMATKARLMSKALPIINTKNSRTLIIFVNQVRSVITTWGGGGTTTPGGRALGFYSSLRLQVKRDRDMLYDGPKSSTDPVGQIVKYKITKNKTAPPFKTGSFKFFFDGKIKE